MVRPSNLCETVRRVTWPPSTRPAAGVRVWARSLGGHLAVTGYEALERRSPARPVFSFAPSAFSDVESAGIFRLMRSGELRPKAHGLGLSRRGECGSRCHAEEAPCDSAPRPGDGDGASGLRLHRIEDLVIEMRWALDVQMRREDRFDGSAQRWDITAALAIPLSSFRRCRSEPFRTRSLIAAVPLPACGDPITAFRRSVISVYTTH
jgi:hypothetical protein